MTFTKHTCDRRSHAQIRPLRRAEPHPIQDLPRGHAGGLILSLPQDDARERPAPPAWSSLTVKAATTLSYCAGHALPALLLGFFSWAVAEILAGFAAYAEAMYLPPAPKSPVPVETQATDAQRGAKPTLNLMMMHVNGSAGYSNQARPSARTAALPAEWRSHSATARTDWHVSLTRIAVAWWSSMRQAVERRRAIAELRALDDRALRDIGVYRCDIEYIVRHGARGE
jgi:uncharacterized protein YjiS (DUF1127 family)